MHEWQCRHAVACELREEKTGALECAICEAPVVPASMRRQS